MKFLGFFIRRDEETNKQRERSLIERAAYFYWMRERKRGAYGIECIYLRLKHRKISGERISQPTCSYNVYKIMNKSARKYKSFNFV